MGIMDSLVARMDGKPLGYRASEDSDEDKKKSAGMKRGGNVKGADMKKPKVSPKKVMMAMMAKKAASSPMGGAGRPPVPAMGGMKKGGTAKKMPSSDEMGSMSLKKGGSSKKMATGGKAGCYARGGGVETKGKTKGKFV